MSRNHFSARGFDLAFEVGNNRRLRVIDCSFGYTFSLAVLDVTELSLLLDSFNPTQNVKKNRQWDLHVKKGASRQGPKGQGN